MSVPRRPRMALGVLAIIVVTFALFATAHMFPARPYGLADDWRVFYAAGDVIRHGGSPYNSALIHLYEQKALFYANVQPSLDDFANLPIVGMLLAPLTLLPFWVSYALFTICGLFAAFLLFYHFLKGIGWKAPIVWAVCMLFSWVVLVGVFSGQFDLILLSLFLATGFFAQKEKWAYAAALAMSAAIIKPHLLWPLPFLVSACCLSEKKSFVKSVCASLAVLGISILAGEIFMPGSTKEFFSHLFAFGGRIADSQPDLAGLPGLVEHLSFGHELGVAMTVAGGIATIVFGVWWATRKDRPAFSHWWGLSLGLSLWLLATPYSHPNDDILLFPLVALLVGVNATNITNKNVWQGLAAAVVIIVLAFFSLAALIVFAGFLALHKGRQMTISHMAGAALVCLAILPTVWPFHQLAFSLTPIAVALVVVGGFMALSRTNLPKVVEPA